MASKITPINEEEKNVIRVWRVIKLAQEYIGKNLPEKVLELTKKSLQDVLEENKREWKNKLWFKKKSDEWDIIAFEAILNKCNNAEPPHSFVKACNTIYKQRNIVAHEGAKFGLSAEKHKKMIAELISAAGNLGIPGRIVESLLKLDVNEDERYEGRAIKAKSKR
jgi:hypothetical protein